MPYFWDMTPRTLPRPDLNPLANPALERNLSRWAEVYFGNPPEKRDAAVNRLLQEIKNETSEILDAERARRESSARLPERKAFGTTPPEMSAADVRPSEINARADQDVSCPFCQQRNPSDHKFCGQCGGGLATVRGGAKDRSAFARNEPVAEPDSEVQWLRERSLGHLYEAEAPAWRGWKFVLGTIVIALGGLAYMQWDMMHPARPASSLSAPAAAAPPSQNSAPTSALPSNASSARVQRTPDGNSSVPDSSPDKSNLRLTRDRPAEATPASQVKPGEKAEAGIQPASQRASLLAPTSAIGHASTPLAVEAESANADLRLAQRYLAGSMGARDASEAAKLLWKAVGKQNPTAAILLSGLYARGDGVAKSCDQARLLLLAATKHGSPQAAEQLRDLEQHGCQ